MPPNIASNPKAASGGSVTIYMQPTSLNLNWLPPSGSIAGMTPLMRLYCPSKDALDGTWSPPPAVEVL
jgi:hypothetical protein